MAQGRSVLGPQEVLPIAPQACRSIPLTPSHGFFIADLVVAVNGVWILVETFMLKGELWLGPLPALHRAPS